MKVSKGLDRCSGRVWVGRCLCLILIFALCGVGSALGAPGSSPAFTPEPQPRPPVRADGLERAPLRLEGRVPSLSGTGYLPFPMDLSHLTGQELPRGASRQPLPAHWDWREQGKVSAVRNQGTCGACYAFSAIGNFESKLLIDGAGAFDLSENHAKECNWKELNDFRYPSTQPWGSCDGGNTVMTASLFSQKGAVAESCDPYIDQDVACKACCPYDMTLLDWRVISGGVIADPEVLKYYITTYGPIATTMYGDAGKGFDGSYDGSFTLDYTTSGDAVNHGVLIVGWSDSLPPVRGDTRPADGWILKNSWGPEWGDNGYFYAVYGAANLGMGSTFIYGWQEFDPSGEVWYYDDDGWWEAVGKAGGAERTSWGLARFVPPRNTKVTRVEFWTTDATTDVDVYLYDSFDGSAPSNPLASVLDNAFPEAGYHSVVLGAPLAVTSGDEIVVVIKLTNETLGYPLAADPHGPIETERTYISLDGEPGSWVDLGRRLHTDAAIRLRTNTGLPPAPWVTSTSPDFGRSTGVVQGVSLEGRYFRTGAGVKLVKAGQPEVQASNLQLAGSTQITCDFDLAGVASGLWDVVVTNPDGQAGARPASFAVAAEGQKIWKGSASDDWHGADNWAPGGVPGAEDDVLILDVGHDPKLGTTDAAVRALVLEPGAALDLGSAWLAVEGTLTNLGTLKQTQAVASGSATQFLRIGNLDGTETKYYGLDLTGAAAEAAAAQPTGSEGLWEASVSISGDQWCTGRRTGVRRCFEITGPPSLQATGRFYYREAERSGLAPEELVAYHYEGRWLELEGPYTRGGSGEALYVEVGGVTGSSPFALDLPGRGTQLVHLPLVLKDWRGGPGPYVTPTSSPTPDVNGPFVLDSTTFAPSATADSTYLVGRVANPMDRKATHVKIYSTFFDDAGSPLGSGYTFACINNLAPGMTSPFVDILSNLPATSWSTYTLSVEWQDYGEPPLPLEVQDEASHFDDQNAFHVTGTARNPHNQALQSNRACVAMLDGAGKTMGVWWDNLANLEPGTTDEFDVEVYFWKGKPDQDLLADYSLQVYAVYGPRVQAGEWAEEEVVRQSLEELQRLIELDAGRSR